jgi:tetratricopeptide (TPR) repeat protein
MSDNEPDTNLFGTELIGTETDRQSLEKQLALYQQHLAELPDSAPDIDRARVLLDIAETQLALEHKEEAWNIARETLDVFLQIEHWQEAVECCNLLFQAEQPASLAALGQGVWLAVTFPIQPDTTIAMLQHIIDETPTDSDGAAVAAITAHYIADIRSSDEKHHSLTFLTQNLLGQVAKRHSNVSTQDELDAWLDKLQLKDPQEFLPRLATVIDVLVQNEWWFDRGELRAKLPVH